MPMSVPHLLAAAPAAAHDPVQQAARVLDMSAGRLAAVAAGLAGLAGVLIGAAALARPAGRFGTGNGLGGAFVALAVGLVGAVLGGLALRRARRSG